jgi:sugar O-acyltransferase (sialic acid O-acetyltransferase NeuD family)
LARPQRVVVLGAGGHALSVLDAAIAAGWAPIAVVDNLVRPPEVFSLPRWDTLENVDLKDVRVALGIGSNLLREALFVGVRVKYPDVRFATIVHPSAVVSRTAELGEGSVVLSQASIGPEASLGLGCLINTGASIDHQSSIGHFVSLAPGARTGGQVRVEDRTFIGLNASLEQGVHIGKDAVIGAQSFVNKSLPDRIVAYGSPAREVRLVADPQPPGIVI